MKRQLVLFYQKDYIRIKQLYARGKHVGIVLLFCKEIQLLSIIFPSSKQLTLSYFNLPKSLISFVKFYPIVCWKEINDDCPKYFQVGVTVLMLLFMIILSFLIFVIEPAVRQDEIKHSYTNEKKLKQIVLNKSNQKQNNQFENSTSGISTLKLIISVFCALFEYVLFQPCIYIILNNIVVSSIQFPQSTLNVLTTLQGVAIFPIMVLFYIFTTIHKVSNRFLDPDKMGIFTNKFNYIFEFLNLMIIILEVIMEYYQIHLVTKILSFCYYAGQYWVGSRSKYYFNFKLQLISNQLNAQIILIISLFILKELYAGVDEGLQIFLFVFLGPLVALITQIIANLRDRKMILFNKNQTRNQIDQDWQLRFVFYHTKCIFLNKRDNFNNSKFQIYHSLLLYNILSNHLQQCQGTILYKNRSTQCFCRQYFPNLNEDKQQVVWDKYVKRQLSELDDTPTENSQHCLSEKDFKGFILYYIKNEYESFLRNRSQSDFEINLSYIYFLIEILKIPTKAFVETLQLLKMPSQKSLKKQMSIHSLLITSKIKFTELILRKQLKNQKYQLQICFQFDESLVIVKENIFITLSLMKDWFFILSNQRENITDIFTNGQVILQQIQAIESQLNQLFTANPLSKELDQLYSWYFKYLNFHQKRNILFKKNSKFANEFAISPQSLAFSKDSCIVNITLLYPIGQIVRCTSNFAALFGEVNNFEFKTLNISRFMPDILARSHDQYLENFIEKGRMNIVNSEQRFLIVKTKNQYIVPVIAKIKLEDSYDDDFGASAIITKINTPYHYLLVNQYCLIEEVSKDLYQIFAQQLNCTIDLIKTLDLLFLIPQLLSHWQNFSKEEQHFYSSQNSEQLGNQKEIFDVTMIFPKKSEQINLLLSKKLNKKKKLIKYFQTHQEEVFHYFENLLDLDLYNLKIKIIPITTISQSVYILEIQSIRSNKRISLEEKKEKVRAIIANVFPFFSNKFENQSVKDNQVNESVLVYKTNDIEDIANLDDFLAFEDDQMGDVLSQNLFKMINVHTASNQIKLLTSQIDTLINQNDQNATCQIISLEIAQQQAIQSNNLIFNNIKQVQESVSEDFTESSDPLQIVDNYDNKIDQNSITSSCRFQDQLVKRNIIRQVIFEKNNQKKYQIQFLILQFCFFSLMTLSALIFIHLQILQKYMENFDYIYITGRLNQQYNQFIVYHSQSMNQGNYQSLQNNTLLEIRDTLQYLTQIEGQSFNFTPCSLFEKKDNYSLNLEFELFFLYNLMHQIAHHVEQNYTEQLFIENYVCYLQMFGQIDTVVVAEKNNDFFSYQTNLKVVYILSIILLILFCTLLIPFEISLERQKINILALLQTLNQPKLTFQFQLLQQLIQLNYKTDQNSNQLAIEDLIETSKSKQNFFESKHFIQRSTDNRQTNNQVKQPKKQEVQAKQSGSIQTTKRFANIPFKIALIVLIFLLIQSYFSTSYVIYLDEIENKNSQLTEFKAFSIFSQQFLIQIGQLSILTMNQFNTNLTFQRKFIQYMAESSGDRLHVIDDQWQQLVEGISGKNNLQTFSTSNFCEIFQFSTDSIFNYNNCQNIPSLQTGFIIIIMNIKEFYISITDSMKNNLVSDETTELINKYFMQIQINSIFAIKALDILHSWFNQTDAAKRYQQQVIIFSIYMVLLLLLYIWGVCYAKIYIFQSLQQAKMLLSLIPMEILLDNSYIMSFVLKQQRLSQI